METGLIAALVKQNPHLLGMAFYDESLTRGQPSPTSCLTGKLDDCGSYSDARRSMIMLGRVSVWRNQTHLKGLKLG